MGTLYEQIGGEDKLRRIITELVNAMREDILIGYLFQKVDPAALMAREFEHAAQFLGAGIRYGGRPLAQVHHPLRILPGQFDRRLTLLRSILQRHGVAEGITRQWLAHQQRLKAAILKSP